MEQEIYNDAIHVMSRQELVNDFLDNKKNFSEECINFIMFLHQFVVEDSLLRSIPPLSKGRKEALSNSKTKNAEVVEDKIISFFQKPGNYNNFLISYPKKKIYVIPTSFIYEHLSDYERKGNLTSIQKLNKYLEKLNFEFEKSESGNKYIKLTGRDKALYISKFPLVILNEISEMGYKVDFSNRTVLSQIMYDDENDSEISLIKDDYTLDDLKKYNINFEDLKPFLNIGAINETRTNLFKIIDKNQFLNLLNSKHVI